VRRIATIEAPRPLAPSALLADPWMLRKVLEGRRQAFKEDRRQALGDRRRVRCLYRSEEVPLFRAPLRAKSLQRDNWAVIYCQQAWDRLQE
jgi:hypothetical protein